VEAIEIKWTSRAKKDLRKVYEFYSQSTGEEKAFEIISNLLERVDLLSNPKLAKMGVEDEQFKHLKHKYKKLIEEDIKITYRLSTSQSVIYINRIFDTRQHPSRNK